MQENKNGKILSLIVLIFGVILMLLGSPFLISGISSSLPLLISGSFLLIIIGVFCSILAIKLKKRSLYMFFSVFFILYGLYLLLHTLNVIHTPFNKSWPIVSIFAGLALMPAGRHRYGHIRPVFMIPAASLIVLGAFLMIFALHLVPVSFKQFIIQWWPVIIFIAGIMLVLLSISGKKDEVSDKLE